MVTRLGHPRAYLSLFGLKSEVRGSVLGLGPQRKLAPPLSISPVCVNTAFAIIAIFPIQKQQSRISIFFTSFFLWANDICPNVQKESDVFNIQHP